MYTCARALGALCGQELVAVCSLSYLLEGDLELVG